MRKTLHVSTQFSVSDFDSLVHGTPHSYHLDPCGTDSAELLKFKY